MSIKIVELEGIGTVRLAKRRGSRRLRLRTSAKGEVVVSIPSWLPFKSGERFAVEHKEWINKHRTPVNYLLPNRQVGKNHTLLFQVTKGTKPSVKVNTSSVVVSVPVGLTVKSLSVQAAAVRGCRKALKSQEDVLEKRLKEISASTGLKYSRSRYGFMKTRWGSCRNDKSITLNYHLLELRDELRDYVIIHELAHTEHLNHSSSFWELVESFVPNFKLLRKEVKNAKLWW